MNKLQYHFLTRWHFDAPAERVWSIIFDAEAIARRWPGIVRFKIMDAEKGLQPGCRIAAAVRSVAGNLDFTLEVTKIEDGRRLVLACRGDLEGEGHWLVEQRDDGASSEFKWDVSTTEWFMNLLGLVIKPVLVRSHDRMMAAGYRVVAEWLEGSKVDPAPVG